MGFKAICGFDHMSAGSLTTYTGLTIKGNNYGVQPYIWMDPSNRLRLRNNGLYSTISIYFGDLGLDFSKRIMMGYRLSTNSLDSSGFFLSQGLGSGGNDITWSCVQLGMADNSYIEAMLDFVNNKVLIYVDGVKKIDQQYTAADLTRFRTSSNWLTFYGNNQDIYSSITDIYFRDEGPGEPTLVPLGRVIATPVIADEITGAGWVAPADSTLTSTLNKPLVAGNEGAPVITNPGTGTVSPLVSKLKLAKKNLTTIHAVSIIATGMDNVAPAKTMVTKLSLGGVDKQGNSVPLTTALAPSKRYGVFDKAPSGDPWSVTNLEQTSLTITPT